MVTILLMYIAVIILMRLNDHSYVRQLSGLSFESLHTNLAWWVVTQMTLKIHETVKIAWDGRLPETIQ